MASRSALPLESHIRRLALLPSNEKDSPEAFQVRFQILGETLKADAFVFLEEPENKSGYSVLAGQGLLAPLGKVPPVSPSICPAKGTPDAEGENQSVYSLKGPFSDAFLVGEKAKAVLVACLRSGKGLAATLALRRKGRHFTLPEENRFASIAYVLNLEMLSRRPPGVSDSASGPCLTSGFGHFPQFIQALGSEISRSRRNSGKVAVGVLSLGGVIVSASRQEKMMERVAGVMKIHLRDFDTLVRYSSLELAFILPDAGGEEALGVMNRILGVIREDRSQAPSAVHIGISSYPEDGTTVERLIETAEAALNQARDKGDFAVSSWKS